MCVYKWDGETKESELLGKPIAGELEDFVNIARRWVGPQFQCLFDAPTDKGMETYMCGPCPIERH